MALCKSLAVYAFHPDGTLPKNGEIFVFGSNLAGRHGKGAALVAKQKYGAVIGIGRGRMGQSYGIPTKSESLRVLPLESIQTDVGRFLEYATHNAHERFFVSRVGCGLAGFSDGVIAPLFVGAPNNVSFPSEWREWLSA